MDMVVGTWDGVRGDVMVVFAYARVGQRRDVKLSRVIFARTM